MDNPATGWRIKLARTLWFNMYRAMVEDAVGGYVATLRLIPAIPLDRADVPADAPEVEPYVLVLVEAAVRLSVGAARRRAGSQGAWQLGLDTQKRVPEEALSLLLFSYPLGIAAACSPEPSFAFQRPVSFL